MKTPIRFTTLALLAATMAACSTLPPGNAMLDQARSDYRAAQANTQTEALAPVEMKQAGEALALANAAQARKDEPAMIDQLAYLSRRRTALAQETAARKQSEAAVATATADRDKVRLEARTLEADRATRNAAVATADAAQSKRQSESAMRDAAASQRAAASSQMRAGEAERRNQALMARMQEMKAEKTDRGMVVTLGDLLFDTGRAELKAGAVRDMQRLGEFLREYPQRRALIEGYTDSVGPDAANQVLSERRAGAVMTALLGMGVGRDQLTSQGYGETHPVAGNDDAGGRQMNRRVEIVLSDENGALTAR